MEGRCLDGEYHTGIVPGQRTFILVIPSTRPGPDPSDPDLQTIARTYYEDESADGFAHTDCDQEGDPRVFLGYYARRGATDWELLTDLAPRHYVYTNDMLYAAIASHAADFGNPDDAPGGHTVEARIVEDSIDRRGGFLVPGVDVSGKRTQKLASENIYIAEQLASASEKTVASALGVDPETANTPATLIENANKTLER